MMYPGQPIGPHTIWVFLILMTREMVWKGIALRKAGTNKKAVWFICLFILNTMGLLPIIYLLFFAPKKKK